MNNILNDNLTISVMVVDDHDMVRIGLKTAIDTHKALKIVADTNDGREALTLYQELQPDVVLMDLVMPELNGIETARQILNFDSDAKIIALTSYEDDELVQSAVDIGVKGYVLKHITMAELETVIMKVYKGGIAYGQEATESLIRINQNKEARAEYSLTSSEIKVLRLVTDGLSNSEIAQELVISTSTAKKHVSNILAKLDASNRAEAAAIAVRYNLFK